MPETQLLNHIRWVLTITVLIALIIGAAGLTIFPLAIFLFAFGLIMAFLFPASSSGPDSMNSAFSIASFFFFVLAILLLVLILYSIGYIF